MDYISGSPELIYSSPSEVEEFGKSEEVDDCENEVESNYFSWIDVFCSCTGHEYFIPVDEDYIRDDFNLKDLDTKIPRFKQAWYMILNNDFDSDTPDADEIETCAGILYGLIHARFIITQRGMQLMQRKYKEKTYGTCPNVLCENIPVLPIGLSDEPYQTTANIFCPRCKEVYKPPYKSLLSNLDGAYFGTSFPHIYFLQYPIEPTPLTYYVPKIYGFKVHRKVKDFYREWKTSSRESKSSSEIIGRELI